MRIIRESVVPHTLGEWVPTGSVPVEEETQLCLWGFECWRSHSDAQIKWARIKRLVSNAPFSPTSLLTHISTLLYDCIEGKPAKRRGWSESSGFFRYCWKRTTSANVYGTGHNKVRSLIQSVGCIRFSIENQISPCAWALCSIFHLVFRLPGGGGGSHISTRAQSGRCHIHKRVRRRLCVVAVHLVTSIMEYHRFDLMYSL